MKLIISIVALLCLSSANAKLVQILHTNDVHSYFDHVDHDPKRGGYARLKTLIDKYKASAAEEGIKTIVVDAGDFSEGHMFYMANFGRRSFNIQNQIGYDVVVMGNHDYLMGTDDLDHVLADSKPNYALLGANMEADSRYTQINNIIKPYHEMEVDGVKIAFLGLTTNEIVFKWRLHNGDIKNPITVGKKYDKVLKKKRKNHVVIGLTHLGLKKDKKLVKKTKDIDLIIGGHSHHFLHEPVYEKNRNKKKIPIVQAGKHAEVMGRLLIDVDENGLKEIVDYELVPVKNIEEDELVRDYVTAARVELDDQYGKAYLDKHMGFSKLEPGSEGQKLWNFFITDAVMESTGSDISVHTPSMSGSNHPIGKIRRYDLYNSHPRWFDFNDEKGWFVYRAKIKGFWIKPVFRIIMNFGLPLSFTGVTFKWKKNVFGKWVVRKLRIKGKRIKPFKDYEIALPEGIARGGPAISPLVNLLLRKINRTPYTVIQALEFKLESTKDRVLGPLSLDPDYDRVYFPGNPR